MEQEDNQLRSDADNFGFSKKLYERAADMLLTSTDRYGDVKPITNTKFNKRLDYMSKHVENNPDFRKYSEILMEKFHEAIENEDGMFDNEQKAQALMAAARLQPQISGKDVDAPGNMANSLYDEAMNGTFQKTAEKNQHKPDAGILKNTSTGVVQRQIFAPK